MSNCRYRLVFNEYRTHNNYYSVGTALRCMKYDVIGDAERAQKITLIIFISFQRKSDYIYNVNFTTERKMFALATVTADKKSDKYKAQGLIVLFHFHTRYT